MSRRFILLVSLLSAVLVADTAFAQQMKVQRTRQYKQHRLEITPFGGYSWTFSRSFYDPISNRNGEVDIKSGGFWGVELDFNAQPDKALALLYQRQDSKLTFKSAGIRNEVADLAVEYWQIGGVGGMPQGNVTPFGMFTLGGTRYILKGQGFSDDTWKFSFIFGLGAKVYVSEKVGLRIQGRLPWTIFSGGAGIGCGSGGCYTSIGGTGIAQIDVSAGLMILL